MIKKNTRAGEWGTREISNDIHLGPGLLVPVLQSSHGWLCLFYILQAE
jgi:hypothetical protein